MSEMWRGLQGASGENLRGKPPGGRLTIVAGYLTLAAGFLSLANGLGAILGEVMTVLGPEWIITRYTICGFIILGFGVVAVVGGLSAIRGWNTSLALAGAASGMAGGGVFGFFLGLGAIVLIFLSNEDI